KFLAEPGLVGRQHVLDLMHDDAFAGRAALVQAEILVGVETALPMEHPDFETVVKNDAAVAFGEIRNFRDEYFRHPASRPSPRRCRAAPADGARKGALSRVPTQSRLRI